MANAKTEVTENANEIALATTNENAIANTQPNNLSPAVSMEAAIDFQNLLKTVQDGFGANDKVEEVYQSGAIFSVVDARIVKGFVDKKDGTLSDKYIFVLKLPDGRIARIMQSESRPRKQLAAFFLTGEAMGYSIEVKNCTLKKLAVVGQIQPATIVDLSQSEVYVNGQLMPKPKY